MGWSYSIWLYETNSYECFKRYDQQTVWFFEGVGFLWNTIQKIQSNKIINAASFH